jgi:glutamate synthase domain-containing protein 3
MVKLAPLASVAGQDAEDEALVAAGKGRLRHRDVADETLVRGLIERHLALTGSTLALAILDDWERARGRFVKVFPDEYQRALAEMYARRMAAKAGAAGHAEAVALR